jgi:hypothetical protein
MDLVTHINKNYLEEREVHPDGTQSKIVKKMIKWAVSWSGNNPDTTKWAWCAIFLSYVLNELFVGYENFKLIRALDFAKPENNGGKCKPIYGCMAVYYRGKYPNSGKGHVAILIRQIFGYDLVLGGNQNNKVCYQMRSRKKAVGYFKWKHEAK